jgi:hypothetical protein
LVVDGFVLGDRNLVVELEQVRVLQMESHDALICARYHTKGILGTRDEKENMTI